MIKKIFQRALIGLVAVIISVFSLSTKILNPVIVKNAPLCSCYSLINDSSDFNAKSSIISKSQSTIIKTTSINQYNSANAYDLKGFFNKIFGKEEKKETIKKDKTYVYLGGFPLGFTIMCNGVVVVAKSNSTAASIKEGDIITKIENKEVSSVSQILTIINSDKYKGKSVSIEYISGGKTYQTKITPIFDDVQKIYKLGLWVRDNAAGVGTITYIRKDNYRFGALGHPVCDIDTGSLLPAKNGNIFRCNIVGYKKGVRGSAGELKGLFLRGGSVLGTLDKNNDFGVYGEFDKNFVNTYNPESIEVASRDEVKSGKATIRCTINGTVPEDYEIEIVRTYFQSSKSNKSMFIRVTDKRLLSTTGGIIQGMSGSPIIQNGKLVGAVTHVFVSDPTKGYGIYADWMIDN